MLSIEMIVSSPPVQAFSQNLIHSVI